MARFLGIDVGDAAVKLAEIDGSYRKTRLLRWRVEPLPVTADGAARAQAIAAAIHHAISDGKFGGEPVLGHPCREAVLRTIEVPFSGTDAIRKVVKAEVEGAIFSHPVDDMVVDFHEIGKGAEGTRILVAAVPKSGLRVQLAALERQGLEPERVDLDTMALYRAAHWAGVFDAEPVAQVPATADGALPPAAFTAVLDLGARSSRILLVEGDNLIDMRTLRLGDASIADELAHKHGLSPALAREAMHACLATGSDFRAEPAAALPAAVEDEAVPQVVAPVGKPIVITHAEVEAGQTAFLQRLARELVRFLTAMGRGGSIRALWVTGGASRTPGMNEMLGEVFGCAPQRLDLVGHLAHDLEPDQADAADAGMATAVGLALSGLGGPTGFDLRQEDLAYTRGFDRIKFPLAITCMVAVFTAVVYTVMRNNDLKNLEFELGRTYVAGRSSSGGAQFYGMLYSVLASKWFENPQYFQYEKQGKNYDHRALIEELHKTEVPKRLAVVRDRLRQVVEQKQESSGIYENVSLESGLAVLVRWAEVLQRAESSVGRVLLWKLDLKMKSASSRSLDFTIAIRGGEDLTLRTRGEALKAEFVNEAARPDSPFASVGEPKETVPADVREVGVPCIYYDFSLKLKDEFEPFGGARVGALERSGREAPGLLASAEEVRR
ncbi:MAG: pilus assembly protein PilM [Planctomycetes bacterium]|nr:pilus assembly protein PilM [Planctomycetota bacterium]